MTFPLRPARSISSFLRTTSRQPSGILISKQHFSSTARIMAAKQEWMIILPDTPGALKKRMEVRPEHLANVKPNVESGLVVFGGASLDEPVKEGEPMKINGSMMMCVAENRETVMEYVRSDIYFKEGVWDENKIQIIPFKSAVRKEL